MLISREKFDELLEQYGFTDSEAEDACNFVCDLLTAGRDLTEKRYPSAFNTVNELDAAAYKASGAGCDISSDNFGEE